MYSISFSSSLIHGATQHDWRQVSTQRMLHNATTQKFMCNVARMVNCSSKSNRQYKQTPCHDRTFGCIFLLCLYTVYSSYLFLHVLLYCGDNKRTKYLFVFEHFASWSLSKHFIVFFLYSTIYISVDC